MSRHALLAITLALATAACHATPPAASVVVKSLTAGDRACYLEATDAAGATVEHLATFEVCEQTALIGKAVMLSSRMESVSAEACQGDPECTQTEQVMLVVKIEAAK
jgi:hypothetical protein